MKKQEKIFFVDNLKEEIKSATSLVLIDYTGLTVKAQQDLKKRLKAVDAKMLVIKNTLFKLAGDGVKLPQETISDAVLSGPTAIVVTEDDPIAPLQVLAKFAKEFQIPSLKVGVVEGNFQDKETLTKLATLPSKEILLGQAVGAIATPMYGIVGVLQANLQKLVWILTTKSKMIG